MMELLQGRPQDETGRPQKEIRTYDLLDSLGIPFVRVDHEVHNTMESCAQVDELLQIEICKNLFLCNRQETSFYLLMMPGESPLRRKTFPVSWAWPVFPLENRNTWNSFWTSPPVPSASWG